MKDYVYDIETFPNVFTMYVGDVETRECWGFEISNRKDHRVAMVRFLRNLVKEKGRLVGFNNIGFDEPVLHYFLKNQQATPLDIYNHALSIIESEEKFEHLIRAKDRMIPQLDLYKIHHFDNRARSTSLKMLEFVMRSDNIEELPFKPGTYLTDAQIDDLLKYNKHDMYQTYLFYMESKDQIAFREQLTKKYKRDFLNHNDTKIGKDYFIMKLEESNPGCCYHNNGKVRQTKRDSIALSECIFPYVQFERPEFQAVKDWLSRQVITETKGVFNEIAEHELGDLAKYCKMRVKKKKIQSSIKLMRELRQDNPSCWFEEVELKSGGFSTYMKWRVADNINVIVDGFQYDFGTGGIHGSVESTIIDSDDEYVVVDLDVASYYPNLAIINRAYPEHLGESFCDIYQDVYEQRKKYAKGTAENAMMKLALNGTYGASNDKFSPFYDPKFTMTITINGQLSLCMLAERLSPISKIIQINTDGVTIRIRRDKKHLADAVCEQWMKDTGLVLEENIYKRMAIRDVNSYLALDENGKVKQKGAYQHSSMGWHQNHSALVIPLASERNLLYDEDIEDVVMGHENIYDFMYRTKVPRSSRLVGIDDDGREHELQNITRYYISNEGVRLVKVMPPLKEGGEERRIGINIGEKVRVCNDIKDFNGNIKYQYYIDEAEKLTNPLKENSK